ncbi:MAG: hypothetical protein IKO35_04205 [Elusimicrobiaceae bacterium]|nr:hypothetical protein [Elusimicrobiaceae bacterium]
MKNNTELFSALWEAAATEQHLTELVQLVEKLRPQLPPEFDTRMLVLFHRLCAAQSRAASVKHSLLVLFHDTP